MKLLKTIMLYILLLVVLVLCSTAVMKVLDLIFSINYENIWDIGYKVGFAAWLFLSGSSIISKKRRQGNEAGHDENHVS